ncbi:hypothetical protein EV648_12122 [Kribbella sp. VKM Ac-2568]|nr:hypothetical protein EV648_12122 [Kribbella sp. VKM Ac-2568]
MARWLSPAMDLVPNKATMRLLLRHGSRPVRLPYALPGGGRLSACDAEVVGGLMLRLLPLCEEGFEIGWRLLPAAWGRGSRPRRVAP